MNPNIRGRGSADNPANRFDRLYVDNSFFEDFDSVSGKGMTGESPQADRPETCFYRDHSKTVMSRNQSPDIPFDYSVNPYRGCEHGCIYCYARPTHEYLGFSAGLDFETRIMVKPDAPELLARELSRPGWVPQSVCLSGNTDCYQPAERRLKITRRCLEVLRDFRNPVTIITKNHLVTRDIDILSEMAGLNLTRVSISITSLDPDLTAILEPRTSRPQRRLDAIRQLSEAGIPTAVMTAPIIPALNDHEMPALLKAAREAGATRAGYTMLRLPMAVRPLFTDWLDRHYPDRKDKILNRVRDMRGGKLNRSEFMTRMKGEGNFAEQIKSTFRIHTARLGFNTERTQVDTGHFRIPAGYRKDRQTNLFDPD
ncbi:MAG: PA0069 family radical SAM protein [Balneolaceae bacterium]|nr:MAG: PA0069 family radical SAM protein [Balneolaceae bacterium]